MHFFDHLFSVSQRAAALLSHWALLCEDDSEPGDRFHQGARFHGESLRDFLQALTAARHEITAHLDALTHEVEQVLALLEEAPGALTYPKLCALYTQYVPYLEAYPGLTADALFTLVSDNLLDAFYPLDKPLDPQRSHAAAANYLATRR